MKKTFSSICIFFFGVVALLSFQNCGKPSFNGATQNLKLEKQNPTSYFYSEDFENPAQLHATPESPYLNASLYRSLLFTTQASQIEGYYALSESESTRHALLNNACLKEESRKILLDPSKKYRFGVDLKTTKIDHYEIIDASSFIDVFSIDSDENIFSKHVDVLSDSKWTRYEVLIEPNNKLKPYILGFSVCSQHSGLVLLVDNIVIEVINR